MSEDESVLERLKRASEKAQGASEGKDDPAADPLSFDTIKEKVTKNKTLGNFFRGLYDKYKFVRNVYDTSHYVLTSRLALVLSAGGTWVAEKYWQASKAVFEKYAYDKDGEYNYKKGGTLISAWAPVTAYGAYKGVTMVIPIVLTAAFNFSYDAVVINAFSNKGVFLMAAPEEVGGIHGEFRVRACLDSRCETQENTVEFRIRDSLYLDVTNFFNNIANRNWDDIDWDEFHDTSEVAGGFLRESNICYVEYHLTRSKAWGRFPSIQYAVCEDAPEGNVNEAIEATKARYGLSKNMASPL